VAWAESVTSDPPCILGILWRRGLEVSGIRDAALLRILLPDNHVFCRDVFGLAVGSLALDVGGVQRGGYLDNKAGGRKLRVEVGLDRDDI